MATEEDIDYSLSRVPDEAKQPFWRILFIRIGAICCVSQLMLGAALGFGMTFWDAFLATMLGSVLLQVVSWALGTAAAHEGLSTSLLSRWAGFGKGGSALFGGVVAISMVGWFGVQNSVFGEGMASIVTLTDFLGGMEYPVWAIITGLGITLLVVFGIKAIANFAAIFVPLFVIVVIVAAAIILQNHSLTELLTTAPPGPALTLGAATTMVAGGFIAGAICTPDYARFLKNGNQVFWMTLIGTFVGELGMNLLAVMLAHAMGTENVVDIMMGTSGIIGVIIVVASTVKLNDINLYSSSLGLATMLNALFNKKLSRNALVWTLGIVGTALSVIGIINYFTDFLVLLGVAIPPVAGIMVIDYFVLRRSRKTLDESRAKGQLPAKVENWNPIAIVCWIAGFAVGEITSIMAIGIPGLNSLILAGVLYWAIMKAYAGIKKQDVITFAETDQVL
ncbi:purine-cytosine permease family protein [Paraeggerthella hongkongensis]|uniref:Cytosine permease n=1 Tax=Paraeggerthella hongkongensis TaxID=230658 RepID=A0A3N0B7E3_9ACTN|nr:cytosine permease [Paraeggerthella hongkongensis]RNL43172.1 cytosine permease [Paraeggerthella hongkongensis]